MKDKITKMFQNQEVKVIINKEGTMYNLACTARICGLTTVAKSGNAVVRWSRIKDKLTLIRQNLGIQLSDLNVDKVKKEINRILDDIENIDDRNSIYMSSWLSKRLAIECHSDKAMKYKDYLVTLDEDFQSGKLFNQSDNTLELVNQQIGLMNKQVGGVIKEVQTLKQDVTDIKENSPLYNIECKEIQSLVRKVGVKSLGGHEAPAYKDNSLRGKIYSDIQRQLKREFNVRRYEAIKRCQLGKAREIIEGYRVPTALHDEITVKNNQVHM
jgi:hypothetical protein